MYLENRRAIDIAYWFLAQQKVEEGDSITNLKLQKLVYYSQAWSMVFRDKPLFADEIQAWDYGPVIPSLYKRYKKYKFDNILSHKSKFDFPDFSDDETNVLNFVFKNYGEMSGQHLSKLTHEEDPWKIARAGWDSIDRPCKNTIVNESMKAFYDNVLAENEDKFEFNLSHFENQEYDEADAVKDLFIEHQIL